MNLRDMDAIHVYPSGEVSPSGEAHVASMDCWCEPSVKAWACGDGCCYGGAEGPRVPVVAHRGCEVAVAVPS